MPSCHYLQGFQPVWMEGLEEEWRSASKLRFQQNAPLPSVLPLHVVRADFKNHHLRTTLVEDGLACVTLFCGISVVG